tara:strand:- start:284 stop:424 length:141 start_codon:yes stop_codon:yes gene_type:complete
MNFTLFWILFLGLWAIVPVMIIKGRKDTPIAIKSTSTKEKKKKGWF